MVRIKFLMQSKCFWVPSNTIIVFIAANITILDCVLSSFVRAQVIFPVMHKVGLLIGAKLPRGEWWDPVSYMGSLAPESVLRHTLHEKWPIVIVPNDFGFLNAWIWSQWKKPISINFIAVSS